MRREDATHLFNTVAIHWYHAPHESVCMVQIAEALEADIRPRSIEELIKYRNMPGEACPPPVRHAESRGTSDASRGSDGISQGSGNGGQVGGVVSSSPDSCRSGDCGNVRV